MGIIVIAGGATGIGEAAWKAFCAPVDDVLLADINVENGKPLAKATGASFVEVDLSVPMAP